MNEKSSVSRAARSLSLWCLIFFACFAAARAQSATFVVNSTADTDDGACTTNAGGCTLREAINAANATAALDNITFDIGTATPSIVLASGLPAVLRPVNINGNTNGATRVELNGNNLANSTGLFFDGPLSGGSTISRLVVNRFVNGIFLNRSNNNIITGNFIGTDTNGSNATGYGNANHGIFVASAQNNLIGGTTGTTPGGACTGACNLISGNGTGINLEQNSTNASSSNIIQGNFIGTDVTGTLGRGNGNGIRTFNGAGNTQIGGATAAARNIISANGSGIVFFFGSADGTIIQGNYIGVNTSGSAVVANTYGIRFLSSKRNITIGGAMAGAGNVISGNSSAGIYGTFSNSTIQGNLIGTDATGTLNFGNGYGNQNLEAVGGISLLSAANNNVIGGAASGAGNIIAYNYGAGIRLGSINSASAAGAGNQIRGNRIYRNEGLGISLANGSNFRGNPVANDALDADTGQNNFQNYPVLAAATESGGTITVTGTFNSLPNTSFDIEFFASAEADPSGYGEGQTPVGSQNVTTDGSGDAVINFSYAAVTGKPFTTATATNVSTGDTSEFSNAAFVANPGQFVFSAASYRETESAGVAVVTVNRVNGTQGAACVDYTASDGSASAADSDYAPTSGTLCFADGENSKTFTVTIIGDAAAEQDETVILTLSNPTGGSALGLQNAATLTIINDDSFATLTVNSIADTDDGACSATGSGNGCTLREAINAANATVTLDTIHFEIGAGNPTITLSSSLPPLTAPVIIDGNTGGATRVEINGNNLSGAGLSINTGASRSTIRRLVINRFGTSGISIFASDNNIIEGNYIGTNSDGTADLGNGTNGITLTNAKNNLIGGTAGTTPGGACAGACNLISGNNNHGISFDSINGNASGNFVQGNYIGTNADGTAAVGNSQSGVGLLNASNNNQIGGTTTAARNLISANGNSGISLSGAGINGVLIQGNYIGTNANATAKLGNGTGVSLFFTATGNTVGGTTAGAGNVISGNFYAGVSISTNGAPPSSPPHDNTVQGNFIGTNESGALDLGNGQGGNTSQPVGGVTISQASFGNQIGGAAGAGNVIAFNYGAGVRLGGQTGAAAAGVGNSILSNSIYSNNGLGIALSDGAGILGSPLANDAGDADAGANNRQNYPLLSAAETNGGATVIRGTLDSAANQTYRIQFFSDDVCDSSGRGEGRAYLGELTGVAPNTAFTFNFAGAVATGKIVTATATNETTGDTSEFSACLTVTAPVDTTAPVVTSIDDGDADDTVVVGETLTYTVNFNEDINASTVTATDFDNAGTSAIEIGAITETLPGVFTVQVTPIGAGTLRLRLPASADVRDASNNALVVPVTDDATITVNAPNNFVSFTVTKTADTNDGACDEDCSLREAITAANADAGAETIVFILQPSDPGYDANADLYTLALASALPDLSTEISIEGPGAIYVAISGNYAARVFNVTSGAVVSISGLTVTRGNSGNEGGGGIQNDGTLTLTNSAVSGNTAGGIGGGGIYNGVSATVNIVNSTISGNFTANGNGGGIAGVGVINITNSTVSDNSAQFGGGIITFSGVATTLTITSSTVSNNSAQNFGGGIAHQHGVPAILRNTIVANNTAVTTSPDLGGNYASQGYNLVGNNSGATISPAVGDQIGTFAAPIDPRLGALQYNDATVQTRALLPGSPAIDRGDSGDLPIDQRYKPRSVDLDDAIYPDASDASDIGSYEAQTIPSGDAPSFVVTKIADTDDGACNNDCSLREAITAANENPGADVITFSFAPGSPHAIQLTAALPALSQSVKIINTFNQSVTVRRDTGGDYRILTVNDGQNVLISGLTVTNGNSGGEGGGIYNGNNANLTVFNSTVSHNTSSGFGGGGIYNNANAILNVTNSTINGNIAAGNGNGGGIAGVGTINITNSTVTDNSAQFGGGIITFTGTVVTVTSSTVTNNSSANFGGGILEQGDGAIIRNTIVANNTAGTNRPDVSGTFDSHGYNLIEDVSGATVNETQNAGTNITGQDPNLGALQNNGGLTATRALLQGSPAIDRGISFGLATDQRGAARPVNFNGIADIGDESDIGAFELQMTVINSISGVVVYGTTPNGSPQKFVPNVTLTAAGTPQISAATNSQGAYSISGLGTGAYTVTPTKTGDVKGIESLDATRIQQHLVGLITLTPDQLIAADVDGNGIVNSLDATRIQQYLVGIPAQNIIGQWKFVPANRQYSSISGNLTGQDFKAILVGDVTGNWTAPTAPVAGYQSTEERILTAEKISAQAGSGNLSADQSAVEGASLTVAGRVTNARQSRRGIGDASLTMTDSAGRQRTAKTASVKYYRNGNAQPGKL